MKKVRCPLCDTEDYEVVLCTPDRTSNRPEEFQLVRCPACSLCYINPRPGSKLLAEFYRDDYEPHIDAGSKQREGLRKRIRSLKEDVEIAVLQHYLGYSSDGKKRNFLKKALLLPFYIRFLLHERNLKKLPWHGEGRILDVGCGTGRFLEWMRDHGWKTWGIDISPAATEKARSKHLNVESGDLLKTDRYESDFFDVVTMWDVFEHLAEPIATLRKAFSLLKPGGRIVAGMPNIDSIPAKLFGKYWFPLEIPRHLVHYSPTTVKRVFAAAGFRVEKIKFRRRGETMTRSLDYLPKGKVGFFCRLLRVKWVRKLIGTILAICHQSGEMIVFAAKTENGKTEKAPEPPGACPVRNDQTSAIRKYGTHQREQPA
jgi:2-polyprenyl-3-methyl-5-hydroxy-6-metoxy-1,4-benzoquinol methylase